MIAISELQTVVSARQILWTEHLAFRMRERKIKRDDVIACIENGEIIEQYPDDAPHPSCLVLGYDVSGRPLHVVCGLDSSISCYMITAYRPALDKRENDLKTRKGGN